MARRSKTAILILCLSFLASGPGQAQTRVTLAEAARRQPPDFAPVLQGHDVEVRGIVSHAPVRIMHYVHVAIQDASPSGLVLDAEDTKLDSLHPGDEVVARGVLQLRSGLPVVKVREAAMVAKRTPPPPLQAPLTDLLGFRYQGMLVSTEAEVSSVGLNAGGEVMMLEGDNGLKVFLPDGGESLQKFEPGDRVRVTGIAGQYALRPPYNKNFQLLIGAADEVTLLEKRTAFPAVPVVTALLSVLLASGVWFLRVRRMNQLREAMHELTKLGEQMIGSTSPFEILARLTKVLPEVAKVTGVRLFLYKKATQTLEKVPTPDDPEPQTIPLQGDGEIQSGASICCRHRALLSIPDTHSGSARRMIGEQAVRSLIFVPMFAREELFGVLELRHEHRTRVLQRDESEALQHLANQVAAALKLLEQQQLQEELSRSEKLAAAGLLISSVVSDLRGPIEALGRLADSVSARGEAPEEAAAISAEAKQASQIVARLASFAWQRVEAEPVDLNRLIENVLAAREADWRQSGIERRVALSLEPVCVLAAEVQLEQVLISLVRRMELALSESPKKWISINSRLLARRALVEASAPVSWEGPSSPGDGLGIDICRSIVQSFGGELRSGAAVGTGSRFEIELPIALQQSLARNAASSDVRDRPLSILVVEPEPAQQRNLVVLLGARGHRVVPIGTAEEAVDLAQRMGFDVILSAVRLSGLNWLELFERVRPLIPAFVLLTEGFDPPLAVNLGYVLRKPVEAAELDRLLGSVLRRLGMPAGTGGRVTPA